MEPPFCACRVRPNYWALEPLMLTANMMFGYSAKFAVLITLFKPLAGVL